MKPKIAALLAKYESGSGELIEVIDGLTDGDLSKRLEPKKWSIREQVHHLADAELNMVQRMKKVISEESPLLPAYDQDKWADNLSYDKGSVEASIAVFYSLRGSMALALRKLHDKDFDRVGIHTEDGKVTLLELLEHSIEHSDHHIGMIRKIIKKHKL